MAVITANALNNVEQTITDNYFSDDIYTFTSSSGDNLGCNYNQIMQQINAGKIVQIKFNNIQATGTSYHWDETNQQDIQYTTTAYFTTYDFVMETYHFSSEEVYGVYLPIYGHYIASTATGTLSADV